MARLSIAVLAAMLCCVVLPALADAKAVSLRVEIPGQQLVPRAPVTLGTNPVMPVGEPPDETCPGDSVVGALDAATNGNWKGTWSASTGWSIDTIKSSTATDVQSRKWFVY